MTVLCSPIPGSEVDGIDGEPDHLGDYIEDNIASNLPGAKMSVGQQEAEFLRSMRDWPGPGPQLTGAAGVGDRVSPQPGMESHEDGPAGSMAASQLATDEPPAALLTPTGH
jgi:hypothetical protein